MLERTFREVSEGTPRRRPAPQPPQSQSLPEREPTLEELLAEPVQDVPAAAPIYPQEPVRPVYPQDSAHPVYPQEPVRPTYPQGSARPVYPQDSARPTYPQGSARPVYPREEVYEEPCEDDDSPILAFLSRNRKTLLIGICAVVLVALIGTIFGIVYVSNADPYDNRILNNVTVAGINLGGMTKEEAAETLTKEFGNVYSETDMVVTLSETILTFSPADTGARLDVDAVVKHAYGYGRTGTKDEKEAAYKSSLTGVHNIGLLPFLNLNEDYIRGVLQDYAGGFQVIYTEASYRLEGEQPILTADKYDPDDPCQTLVITMGTPGMGVDINALFNEIMDAYSLRVFSIRKEEATPDMVPELPDLQAIYDELYIEPVDAAIDMKTFETIPGVYGYDFDLDAAKLLIADADYGEVIEIPMRCLAPEILGDEEMLYRDLLGSCETKHTKDENRNANLKLACKSINGTVLMPGETFSFNNCLGERTEAKGYKPAGTYVGNKLVDTVGGGICQTSTTLYYCTLLADLEIVDRSNHGMPVSYIDYGMDATVSWGGPDFKFRNNTNYPIKLLAEVSDGYVRMKIMGTDEKDYYIKMEYEITDWDYHETVYEEYEEDSGYYDGQVLQGGSDGIYVRSYKVKYEKETNKKLSRDFEARSHYNRVDKVVVKLVEPEEPTTEETIPEETTQPTVPETQPETTEPPTTAPETTEPPTTTESTTTATEGTETPASETEATTPPTVASEETTQPPAAAEDGSGEG